jgi:hypothetical protein
MYNFEVYPISNRDNNNLYGLYIVNTKNITEVAKYDLAEDTLVLNDVIANCKRLSLSKVIADFVKECKRIKEVETSERYQNL